MSQEIHGADMAAIRQEIKQAIKDNGNLPWEQFSLNVHMAALEAWIRHRVPEGAIAGIALVPTVVVPTMRCAQCHVALRTRSVVGVPGSLSYDVEPHQCVAKETKR